MRNTAQHLWKPWSCLGRVVLGASLFLLAGCSGSGAPVGPPGAGPAFGPPGVPGGSMSRASSTLPASMPARSTPPMAVDGSRSMNTAAKPPELPGLSTVANRHEAENGPGDSASSLLEQAGMKVSLAADIIVSGGNPFLSHVPGAPSLSLQEGGGGLPLPTMPLPGTGAMSTTLPPTDPMDSFSLLGVVFNAQMPMALVGVSGGQSQTQMVKKGDYLYMDGGQAKVVRITHDSMELERANKDKSRRTYQLANIIGYKGSAQSQQAATSDSASTTGAPPGTSTSGWAPGLESKIATKSSAYRNLAQLMNGSASATTAASPPAVEDSQPVGSQGP